MNLTRIAAAVFGLSIVQPGSAQLTQLYEKVLLPVVAPVPVPGVFGSSWITDFWMRNVGAVPIQVIGYAYHCFLPECIPQGTPGLNPGATIRPGVAPVPGFQGQFLLVPRGYGDQIAFGLRFRDLSRQTQSWGTEVPVAREAEFRSDRVTLIDVPVTEGFRQVLRIYELDSANERDARVRVRAYRLDPSLTEPESSPSPLLGEAVFQLAFVPNEFWPAYVAIPDLSAIAPLGDAQRIALEIEPVFPGLRIWAFATVVNNETQHATVITPQ
jgi:hypothetical protein